MKKIDFRQTVNLGCDPEFFFYRDGEVIGAEHVLDKNGLENFSGKTIIDGVQAELNPSPNNCIASLAGNISSCFRGLKSKLDGSISVDFSTNKKLNDKEFDAISDQYKQFGCGASKNVYDEKRSEITVNSLEYKDRSAGGHIHLGKYPLSPFFDDEEAEVIATDEVLDMPELVVPVLDILLGNTCVLLDRDGGNAIRRQVYGKAGEYRTPDHGIEYRTLSNFWLKSYPLMSFVFSMARFSVLLASQSTNTNSYVEELKSCVDMKEIAKAIDTNDFDLAYYNFKKISPLIVKIAPKTDQVPLTKDNIHLFHYFVKKGIDFWFVQDPLEHWANLNEWKYGGWTKHLELVVKHYYDRKI